MAFAGIGLENAKHQADGGRFACAVGSDQAEEFAWLDVEGEMIDGGDGAEGSRQIPGWRGDGGIGRRRMLVRRAPG